jgi:flagellin
MASVITTNVASLNAQKNLTKSQSALETALQRLSSGMRINSAKDDAAGLAIATRFTAQINGLNQAARNANDGISLTQTAEGAMNEIVNNLQRIRELSVQSLNASNSTVDRSALDAEVQQLKAEIDRVAQQTAFNGVKVLDGTFTSQAFQVGANANETISVASIASMRTSSLGAAFVATASGTPNGTALTAGDITLTVGSSVFSVGAAVNGSNGKDNTSAYSVANAINAVSAGVTATAGVTSAAGQTITGVTAGVGTITLNGATTGAITIGNGAGADLTAVKGALDAISGVTGVTATINGTALDLTAADGRNITYSVTQTSGTFNAAGVGINAATTTRAAVTLTSSQTFIVAGNAPLRAGPAAGTYTAALTGSSMANIDVLTVAHANTTLASVDAALATVNSARGDMGAYQNRFASTVANIATTALNLSASRSRIEDADYAAETAAMTKNQILQQAGTAMLAQANALPNNVLTLLKG